MKSDNWSWPVLFVILTLAAVGCSPSGRTRMQAYELKELHCLKQYRTGDIQAAKQALLDYLWLVEAEQASGLPFTKTAYTKALIAARLSLICRKLGDARLADQYLHEAVVYARQDAQEERNKAWLEKTDEEIGTLMLHLVTKLDETNTHPKWRME